MTINFDSAITRIGQTAATAPTLNMTYHYQMQTTDKGGNVVVEPDVTAAGAS